MRVILSSDVKSLGKKGDIVNVSDGYANNYLLKNKLAVPASAGNLNVNAMEKAKEAKRIKEETESARALLKELSNVVVNLTVPVGETGKIYGSVSSKEISEELFKMGYQVDRKKIELDNAIKSVGTYKVGVKLYKGVSGKIEVVISGIKK